MSEPVLPFDPPAHKVADVLLPWFVNGTLEDDELAFVQQHLSECVRCQREVEWLRDLRRACAEGEGTPGASPVFQKLRRQLDEPRSARRAPSRVRGAWAGASRWSRWAMAVELAVIVGLGTSRCSRPPTALPLYRTLGAANRRCTAPRDFRRGLRSAHDRGRPSPHIAPSGGARGGRPDAGECVRPRGRGGTTEADAGGVACGAGRHAGRTTRFRGDPLTAARAWLWILLGVCFTACAAMDRADQTKADDRSSERQVLVMLRVAPPHFRPDVSYAGGYTSRVGGPARRRIAEEIARQHHLTIVDDWPMPALGVDCFVMEAAGNTSRASAGGAAVARSSSGIGPSREPVPRARA